MANFSDFLPAAGGGGGGIPKYQEFTTSGTFTPSQELIDAGGRVAYFIVGGGAQGSSTSYGGGGGSIEHGFMTLNSTNGCTVTIGSAGGAGAAGGNSSVIFSSAGGTDITANGAYVQYGSYYQTRNSLSANHGGVAQSGNPIFESGPGINGYGMGGVPINNNFGGGVTQARANSGQGTPNGQAAADGFVRITWFE